MSPPPCTTEPGSMSDAPPPPSIAEPSSTSDDQTISQQVTSPPAELKDQCETDGAEKPSAPAIRPTDFQSPRHSPFHPSAGGSLLFAEDDRYLPNPALLLQSPAPSVDDASSLRVEPPSPRSETSTMDMASFSIDTPVDGQATPHEISLSDAGILVTDPAMVTDQITMVTDQITDKSSMVTGQPPTKDAQSEERHGSEISSEISSLPPPTDEDEPGDLQKITGDVEMTSADKGDVERGVAQPEGVPQRRRSSVPEEYDPACPAVTITMSGTEQGETGMEQGETGAEQGETGMECGETNTEQRNTCTEGVSSPGGDSNAPQSQDNAPGHQDAALPPQDTGIEESPVQDTGERVLHSQDTTKVPVQDTTTLQDSGEDDLKSRDTADKSPETTNPAPKVQDSSGKDQDAPPPPLQDSTRDDDQVTRTSQAPPPIPRSVVQPHPLIRYRRR